MSNVIMSWIVPRFVGLVIWNQKKKETKKESQFGFECLECLEYRTFRKYRDVQTVPASATVCAW